MIFIFYDITREISYRNIAREMISNSEVYKKKVSTMCFMRELIDWEGVLEAYLIVRFSIIKKFKKIDIVGSGFIQSGAQFINGEKNPMFEIATRLKLPM